MKEFLQFVWALFLLVVLVGSIFVRCQGLRHQEPRTYTPPPAPLQLPKMQTPLGTGYWRTSPKLPTWDYHPTALPQKPVAPMPRPKLEVAPMPHEVENGECE